MAGHRVKVGTASFTIGSETVDEVLGASSSLCAYFNIDDGRITGRVECEDEIRPGAKSMVTKFGEVGLKCIILSGDRSDSLRKVADSLGIREFHSCQVWAVRCVVSGVKARSLRIVVAQLCAGKLSIGCICALGSLMRRWKRCKRW